MQPHTNELDAFRAMYKEMEQKQKAIVEQNRLQVEILQKQV